MKVLVTGAGGFIGSHLTELLVKKGFSVKAFVHYNSNNKWGWLDDIEIKKEIEVIQGDIRDYDSVHNSLKGCSSVFHLAALIGIPYSYVSPKAYIETNINGTYNILNASKELGLQNILITSTSETYGTAQYVPIDEKHPMVGQSPYSASKISADQIAISFFKSFDIPVKIVRPFNTFGPRQSARAVIPTIITQILSGKRIISLGNLNPTRDLTYVLDTANGFLEIFKSINLIGEITNIGMNEERSIKDIIKIISEIIGSEIEIELDEKRIRPKNSEVERLICDNSKILKNTSWKPEYSFNEAIMNTINWISKNIKYYKTEIYNV